MNKRTRLISVPVLLLLLILAFITPAVGEFEANLTAKLSLAGEFSDYGVIKNKIDESFTGDDAHYGLDTDNTGSVNVTAAFPNSASGSDGRGNFNTVSDEYGNTYACISFDPNTDTDAGTSSYLSFVLGTDSTDYNGYNYYENKLIILDFDIMADKYVYLEDYTDSNGTVHYKNELSAVKPESGASYTLSYPKQSFRIHNRYGTEFWEQGATRFDLSYKTSSNTWSISIGSKSMSLSDEVGVWNHITLVYDINDTVTYTYTDGGSLKTVAGSISEYEALAASDKKIKTASIGNSKLHLYLDGEYVGSSKLFQSSTYINKANGTYYDKVGCESIKMSVTSGAAGSAMSYCIDNVTANYYSNRYTGPAAELFRADSAPQNLGNTPDLVYNYSYIPPSLASPILTVTDSDGNLRHAQYIGAPILTPDLINSGDTLTLFGGASVEGFTPKSEFYVVLKDGASFSLEAGVADYITLREVYGERIKVMKSEAALFNLNVSTSFISNLYFPITDSLGNSTVDSVRAYTLSGDERSYISPVSITTLDEYDTDSATKYARFTYAVNAVSGLESKVVYLELIIDGVIYDTELTCYSLPQYFENVISSDCDTAAKALIVNTARYCDSIYAYMSNGASSEYTDIYEGSLYLIDTESDDGRFRESVSEDAQLADTNSLCEFISGSVYTIDTDNLPRFVLIPCDISAISSLEYSYSRFEPEDTKTVQMYLSEKDMQDGSGITACYMNTELLIPAYFITSNMQIKLTLIDGRVIYATYSLGAYVDYICEHALPEEERCVAILKALYAYSMASRDYMTKNT